MIVLSSEKNISRGPLGGITEDMNSPNFTAFPDGFLRVKLKDLGREGDRIDSKLGACVEERCIVR